ncbi:uncharacterized protein LOC123872805 [Maniola jurtina]|uniref:uncharacterized protein LOC123872805 n=1 Tax=Maniola jurtina TaxID=191418 RepID=UPI001E68C494|nr:uncharacterized protein LOC123872805 [Maniola jurtina]
MSLQSNDSKIPSYTQLIEFIQLQVKVLERSNKPTNFNNRSDKSRGTYKSFIACDTNEPTASARSECVLCSSKTHKHLYQCNKFMEMESPQARFDFIKAKNACVNCLSLFHTLSKCRSRSSCVRCLPAKKKHHSSLCRNNNNDTINKNSSSDRTFTSVSPAVAVDATPAPAPAPAPPTSVQSLTTSLPTHASSALLSTAQVYAKHYNNLKWNIPGDIDVILGAQLFPHIYLGDKIVSNSTAPAALLTTLGYVLMGDYTPRDRESNEYSFTALALEDLEQNLQKFWELEQINEKTHLSPAETECENLYRASVSRDESGRYSVGLPFSQNASELGNSRCVAHRRLLALERKFKTDPSLRHDYNQIIMEYIQRGYLSEVSDNNNADEGYYIPHHAVIRPEKSSSRVRIVTDASAKTADRNLSLNDVLHTGPNLQADLFLLLLNFRLFPVAMTADIKQMYLQIEILPRDRKYLKILFRFDENEEIRTFQFNRVPFGLKSSPYLAMRSVRQLCQDEGNRFTEAAKIAESQLYMDDLVHSATNDQTAKTLSQELINLFKSGSFELIKWSSNSSTLLCSLPDTHRASVNFTDSNNTTKVLGLSWDPSEDVFRMTISKIDNKCTKRTILSLVARLFDVLGLVAPVILYAKLLIKELWLQRIDWDEIPSEDIIKRYSDLVHDFSILPSLKIPRHTGITEGCKINIVAFSDASLNGYGCVIYIHVTDALGNIRVNLLCSKSKVSPTKVTTLARLELCAALLMSKLVKIVRDTYSSRIPIEGIYAFSDSTVALSWIKSSPHRWNTFVSNRVAQCQEYLNPQHFYHVAGIENPSDCLSRGVLPSQLISHPLWWNGPQWLRDSPSEWPINSFSPTTDNELPEFKSTALLTTDVQCEQPVLYILSQRFSSWNKLIRSASYVLRFARLLPSTGEVDKLNFVENAIIKDIQRVHFSDEITRLKNKKLPSKKLQRLAVFIDNDGILRIGGRLSKSDLPYEAKHPALLPKHDHAVNLIIDHYHTRNCHTGPSLLMSLIRQRFWILDARTIIRSRVHKCNTCFRVKPVHPTPLMADIPSHRLQEAKAFMHTGVDHAGPLRITPTRRRGYQSQKAYICLFVCLVTKAVHIELSSDLTADCFLMAVKRFLSRKGPISCFYSDNSGTFLKAKSQLDEVYSLLNSSDYKGTVAFLRLS